MKTTTKANPVIDVPTGSKLYKIICPCGGYTAEVAQGFDKGKFVLYKTADGRVYSECRACGDIERINDTV